MANRALLHRNKLEDFKKWLVENGYNPTAGKSLWEVIRWKGRKGEAMPIIFDKSNAKEHYTCSYTAIWYVRKWLREIKRGK